MKVIDAYADDETSKTSGSPASTTLAQPGKSVWISDETDGCIEGKIIDHVDFDKLFAMDGNTMVSLDLSNGQVGVNTSYSV
jgi:hypothetical protein